MDGSQREFLVSGVPHLMKDYYAILGIPASATESEVKRAFRKLAVRYHPDKNEFPVRIMNDRLPRIRLGD